MTFAEKGIISIGIVCLFSIGMYLLFDDDSNNDNPYYVQLALKNQNTINIGVQQNEYTISGDNQ